MKITGNCCRVHLGKVYSGYVTRLILQTSHASKLWTKQILYLHKLYNLFFLIPHRSITDLLFNSRYKLFKVSFELSFHLIPADRELEIYHISIILAIYVDHIYIRSKMRAPLLEGCKFNFFSLLSFLSFLSFIETREYILELIIIYDNVYKYH